MDSLYPKGHVLIWRFLNLNCLTKGTFLFNVDHWKKFSTHPVTIFESSKDRAIGVSFQAYK